MNVFVNGESREIADGAWMADLVEELALNGQRFAVEVNAELIPRSRFSEHHLKPGDKIEIIQAVGGG